MGRVIRRADAVSESLPLLGCALFLDFDGTLVPFASTPSQVRPDAGLVGLLRRAAADLQGRLAVVSGRPIAEIDRFVGQTVTCVAGVHGLQRRDGAGQVHQAAAHPRLGEAISAVQTFAAARPGVIAEEKPQSVALHYRAASTAEQAARALARRLARRTGLEIQEGRMVIELRTPGPDKGGALRAFMAEAPFAGATPIYVGDDDTDEAAFAAAARLGGFGVVVGDRRPTYAKYRLSDPEVVLGWVAQSLDRGVFAPEGLPWAR